MKSPKIKFVLEHPDAKVPVFSHSDDACADVYSVEDKDIGPGEVATISLGFRVELPVGWEIQVRSRSGLAAKNGICVFNAPGTIDAGFRGINKVILYNASMFPYPIYVGDRIAQFAFRPVPSVTLEEVSKLNDTERGDGGFGSTGV